MSITVMKQALEALEESHPDAYRNVITSLRQAIAEAEKQEPVAWKSTSGTLCNLLNKGQIESGLWHPLYTHPQPKREWVGLTDEEHTEIQKQIPYTEFMSPSNFAARCQTAVEAKLKEKNT